MFAEPLVSLPRQRGLTGHRHSSSGKTEAGPQDQGSQGEPGVRVMATASLSDRHGEWLTNPWAGGGMPFFQEISSGEFGGLDQVSC